MKIRIVWILAIISMLLVSGCGKFENIAIHGMKDVKLRGMKNNHIYINLTLDIENPNNRKIIISKIHFRTWLNSRELGTIKLSKKIALKPNSHDEYQVPIEIVLRTAADAFKLMSSRDDLLNQITVEGFIKGRVMCISKKIRIEKQPFTQLAKSYKGKFKIKDSLETRDTTLQPDTLKVE